MGMVFIYILKKKRFKDPLKTGKEKCSIQNMFNSKVRFDIFSWNKDKQCVSPYFLQETSYIFFFREKRKRDKNNKISSNLC